MGLRLIYRRATLKVFHPSDVITEISKSWFCDSLLTDMTLVGVYTHGLLFITKCADSKAALEGILDKMSTSSLIREATKICKDPLILYIVKRSFGVQRALLEVQALWSNTVHHNARGVKHFSIIVNESKRNKLINLVKKNASTIGERDTWVKIRLHEKWDFKYIPRHSSRSVLGNFLRFEEYKPSIGTVSGMTRLEYFVLKKAYELGYFEWPRKCSLTDLANQVGLSKSTVLEHLRRALRKLLFEYLELY